MGLARRKATLQTVKSEIRSRQQSVQGCVTARNEPLVPTAASCQPGPVRLTAASPEAPVCMAGHRDERTELLTGSTENMWGLQHGSSVAQCLLPRVGRGLHYQLNAAATRARSRDRVGTLEPQACLDLGSVSGAITEGHSGRNGWLKGDRS